MFVKFPLFLASIAFILMYVCQFLYASSSPAVFPDDAYLNISLENYNITSAAGRLIKDTKLLPPFSTVILNVMKIPETIRFIIVQAHTFQFNVTLSYNDILNPHSFINGTNLGLVQLIDESQTDTKFYIRNENARPNVSVLITVQGYGDEAPVPGGCNMEFSVETAPYLITTFTESVIRVDSQPASAPVPRRKPALPCESQPVKHDMYHMYLPERDFSSETYFDALLKMMTVEDIQLNGRKVPEPLEGSQMRRIYSAYPGTGSVYSVIAKSGGSAVAYVPSLTYACSTVYWTDTCDVLNTIFSKVLCAMIFFLGLFVCLYGHQFFKTETFLLGFLSGGLVFYIVIAAFSTLPAAVNIVLSVILGLCFGTFWLCLWWCYGIPVFSVLLSTLTLGFVIAGITIYGWIGDVNVLKIDINFWMILACIVMTVPLIFLSLIQKANIIACAVLGAYAVIIPIDHYIGSNLKYIIFNIIRRATVKDFRMAVIDPPFQTRDAVLCIVWIALAIIGFAIQWYKQQGKPPFPPPPNSRHREHFRRQRFPYSSEAATERTPLLIEADTPPVHIPCITAAVGNDNVFESPAQSSGFFSFFKRWH